jgi:membrane-bound hydrogenase subunit mbhJ
MAVRMGKRWTALSRVFLGRHLHTETVPHAARCSVFIRHLDGGSSNVVESELIALSNPVYDLAQYGIRFVASPTHADLLMVTGPLTRNMLGPARAAFAAMPEPRAVITVGDFAGFDRRHKPPDPFTGQLVELFATSYAIAELPDEMRRAVVAHVPGDPPEPSEIVKVLLSVYAGGRVRPGVSCEAAI